MLKNQITLACFLACLSLTAIGQSQLEKESAYKSAAETAWQSVIMAEDKERFAKQVEAAEQRALQSKEIREANTDTAKKLLLDARRIQNLTEDATREHYGVGNDSPETALERMLTAGTTYIFVSQGMPDQILANLLRAFEDSDDESIEIVFQGLNPDQKTIPSMFRALGKFGQENNLQTSVHIGLNPTIFTHFSVSEVPTIIHTLPNGRAASMRGSFNLDYFFTTLNSHKDLHNEKKEIIDLGEQGNVYAISERNLMEIIQERAANIDWESKKERAEKQYWQNYNYQKLPSSLTAKTYYVDMRVVVTEDVIADGRLIARAGDVLDPNEHLAATSQKFNRRLIALNPNSEAQLKWAREQVQEALSINEKPVVMLSELHRGHGADTLFKVEEMMQVQMFLLIPEVVQRFDLQALPVSIVQSKLHPNSMLVKEWACSTEKAKCVSAPKPKGGAN